MISAQSAMAAQPPASLHGQGDPYARPPSNQGYFPPPPNSQHLPGPVDSYSRSPSTQSYYSATSTPQQPSFTSSASHLPPLLSYQSPPNLHSPNATTAPHRSLHSLGSNGLVGHPSGMAAPQAYRPYAYQPQHQHQMHPSIGVMGNVGHAHGPSMSMMGAVDARGYPHMSSQLFSPHHPQPHHAAAERPFKCDQCPQSFNRNHDLKRHKRIHLAVKPFPCEFCEKSFSRKDALKRHRLVKGCGEKKRGTDTNHNSHGSPSSRVGNSPSQSPVQTKPEATQDAWQPSETRVHTERPAENHVNRDVPVWKEFPPVATLDASSAA